MSGKTDPTALFKIGYGLYVLTVKDGEKENGCIVNTVSQLTSNPLRVAVTVNKDNYTHEFIKKTGKMNVNCLSTDAPFGIFEWFGFVSGRDGDKFAATGLTPAKTEEGVPYVGEARLVLVCRKLYADDLKENCFIAPEMLQHYAAKDYHRFYICEITDVMLAE